MTHSPELAIQEMYRRAVEAVQPAAVIGRWVRLDDTGRIYIGDLSIYPTDQPIYAIAIGKAAVAMVRQLEATLGDALQGAIAVTKSTADSSDGKVRVLAGSHPVPDERSLEAGVAVLEFAGQVPAGALVICLISGGGSALMESLRPGVTLNDLQQTTSALLRAGATIHELNAVRARLSLLKAGGLLAALEHAQVVNLIISDVLGDDLSTIASGPTVPRSSSEPAEDILRRYGIRLDLPPTDEGTCRAQPGSLIVANLSTAIDAAVEAASDQRLEPVVLSRSLTGEARHVATALAAVLADTAKGATSFQRGTCFISGGETTVTVRGGGKGGRNTESALAAALKLQGVQNVAMGCLATDGDDAETGVAGAIVTGETITARNIREAREALDENDSFTFLQRVEAVWGSGSTGTNVNDLVIGIAL